MTQPTDPSAGHSLKKHLSLRDLVQMQILLVVGTTWIGLAGRQGGTQIVFWLAAILLFFLPSVAVVGWCSRIWPQEGGVYQWTRHTFGPFAGFLGAWNFGIWALLTVSNLGLLVSTSLSYALGPAYAWLAESHTAILTLNFVLFAVILAVAIPGFGIGKYVSHFGTGVMILVNLLLVALLFFHPHTTAAHPHVSPQKPFLFALPTLTLISLNLFSKMAFNGLTGIEQIAVFAGETRNPAKAILRSAWIAAPIIALIFILGTASILTYIPAANVNLEGPVPQILAAAAASPGPHTGLDLGLLLGRAAIIALAIAVVAQYALIVAETSRLPMVAGWDGLVPAAFTRLSPRFGTPIVSILVIVILAFLAAVLAGTAAGAQEAYQILVASSNILYAVYYAFMLAIPLVAGRRFGPPASLWIKLSAASGLFITLLATGFNLYPIVDVPRPWLFTLKVAAAAILVNLLGAFLYYRATRVTSATS